MQAGHVGLSLTAPRKAAGGGVTPIPAPFSRVNGPADDPFVAAQSGCFTGWSVDSVSSISNDTEFTVSRQGYTTSGATTTYPAESFWVSRKVYQPYPNQTTLSTSTYALSDYIYSTDTPAGTVTNNSDLTSPKPVANWATMARGVVGNTISSDSDPIEVVAFHRNARNKSEVACVIFHISDGVNPTIDVTVSAMTESVVPGDRTCVLVYRLPATDITSLNAGVITVNASVYPWIGAAASVLHSTDQSADREFSPRYYQKNTTLAASPYYVCVDLAGNDATGAVSQTQATAEATPCQTIQGALKRLTAVLGGTTGVDGAFIVLNDGTHVLSSTGANQTQKIGRVTVTRSSTSVSRAACLVQGGAGAVTFQLGSGGTLTAPVTTGCIRFKDIRMQRNGIQPWLGGNAVNLEIQIEDCDYDANATGANNTLMGTNSSIRAVGWTNVAAFPGGSGPTSNGEWRLLRGLNFDLDTRGLEMWLVLGSDLNDFSGFSNLSVSRIASGAIVAFNQMRRMSSNVTWTFTLTSGTTVNGLVNAYNLYEWTTVTSGHSFCMSNDSAVYNNEHVIEHGNTYIGWEVRGRRNMFYDEGGTARRSRLHSNYANIVVGDYTKGDIFVLDGTRLGNWAYRYGVGCNFEAAQYRGNEAVGAGAPQSQVYVGRGTTLGTTWNIASQTVAIDFRFTNPQGVTGAASPGAGGGTYTLLSNSPVKNLVTSPIRPKTLDGVAVGTTDNAGAYSAA